MKLINLQISRPGRLSGLFIILALVLAACAPAGAAAPGAYGAPAATSPGAASGPATQTAVVPVTGGGTLHVAANPKLGQILVGADGMTLYTFALDTSGVSNCNSDCTADWPPYTITTTPTGSPDLQAELNTITRSDGSKQVTFNGLPLYDFVADKNPGDVEGDAVTEFGGIWHAARPAGTAAPGSSGGTGGPHY